jgi:uncharacterized membrane-anchored protein YitT (DUF2179 family)
MKDMLKKLVWISIGQFIAATAFNSILLANNLVATGFGGLATVIYHLTGWNIQIMLIMMALPVFLWAFFFYDRRQIFYAAYSYFMFTFYLGIANNFIPKFHTDSVIASLAGGVVMGFAAGIIMRQRVANGPEAVAGLYLKEKTGMTIGTFFLVMNTIIIFSSILYGDLTLIIYSLMSNYVQSLVTDYIMIGGKKFYNVNIMSDQYLEITDFIRKELKRGVTFIQGMDTANVKKKMMIQTVVSKHELITLKEYVKSLQDDSFVYANQSASLLGRGYDLD